MDAFAETRVVEREFIAGFTFTPVRVVLLPLA